MKNKKTNAYIKTEIVLKNYNKLKKSFDLLNLELDDLKKEKKKISKTISKTNKVVLKDEDKNYYYTDETLNNRINELKQFTIKIKAEIKFIDNCLNEIKNDEYFEIIQYFYFENKSAENIAEILDTSTQTIYDNKKRLICELSFLIAPLIKLDEIKGLTLKTL
ncbi:MAG: sigma-70 family RNA polymerase sigma factor [Bacilli bacterium]|nr:sigma-70 family RNA polymerase sigma factor [Bacilli bacterium]